MVLNLYELHLFYVYIIDHLLADEINDMLIIILIFYSLQYIQIVHHFTCITLLKIISYLFIGFHIIVQYLDDGLILIYEFILLLVMYLLNHLYDFFIIFLLLLFHLLFYGSLILLSQMFLHLNFYLN